MCNHRPALGLSHDWSISGLHHVLGQLYKLGHDGLFSHHPLFPIMSTPSHHSFSSARSSSSGGSYYPVPSSPVPIRQGPGHWPSWLAANPPPISGSPSPESRSQNDCAEMDWDPQTEVATEVGEVVHGRLISSFPFSFGKLKR